MKVPAATLRSWTLGRPYPIASGEVQSPPLIRLPRRDPPYLSFWNLVEAHVLRSLRMNHSVSLKAVRRALKYSEMELGIDHLLLSRDLCTRGGDIFLTRYGELINLSASGQMAMRQLFDQHLKRVEWDGKDFPVRLYPYLSSDDNRERSIVIDPSIGFGRPVLQNYGVSTSVIASRIDAGESIREIAADYGLEVGDVEQAVLYERVA